MIDSSLPLDACSSVNAKSIVRLSKLLDTSENMSTTAGDSNEPLKNNNNNVTTSDISGQREQQFTGFIDEETVMNMTHSIPAQDFSAPYAFEDFSTLQQQQQQGSSSKGLFESKFGYQQLRKKEKYEKVPSNYAQQTTSSMMFDNQQNQQEQQLLSVYERDKFINGAIIAIRSKDFPIRKVIEIIQDIAERTVTDNYIRKVWHYWKRFQKVYFSTASKTCIYTKHEAMMLYERISKGESGLSAMTSPNSTQNTTLIPYLKEVLQRNSATKQMMISFSQFEQVQGLNSEENYLKVKDAIENEVQEEAPNWIDVSVKIMISASQFQCKKNIDFQCLAKLREIIYFKSIQWIGVVMGETLNGRGKFIYLHCRFDKTVAKKKKYLKRFLLELIPTYFYSHNCVTSQKVQILNIKRFQKIYFEQCMQHGITPGMPPQNLIPIPMQMPISMPMQMTDILGYQQMM